VDVLRVLSVRTASL